MKNAIPVYINLVHKLKVAQNNGLYKKLGINEEKQNVSKFFKQHEGSPVLEYLMNEQNVDNAPVYMTDFVQMLIALSVDQCNVLLCGHSDQFLGGIYEQWEEAFIAYQNQIIDQLTSSSQFTLTEQEKHMIESQIQFMTKKLNIKPKTIKYFLHRINNDKVQLNFESVDRYLTEINKKYFGQSYELHNSQKSLKSSLTADESDKEEELIWKDWNTFRKLMKNKLSNKLMSGMDLLIELYKSNLIYYY